MSVPLTGTLREDDLGPEARAALLGVFRDWKRPKMPHHLDPDQ
jgi:hypothetical protein